MTTGPDAVRDRRLVRLAYAAAVFLGLAIGVGAFTFVYAQGHSYLSNDPSACANCHIMREHFDAWHQSSHRAAATCNDCHTPHTFVSKYVVKARNGFWHSFYFTTGNYPDPLRITGANRDVTEATCRACHAQITAAIDPGAFPGHSAATMVTGARTDQPAQCIQCHQYVGHYVR